MEAKIGPEDVKHHIEIKREEEVDEIFSEAETLRSESVAGLSDNEGTFLSSGGLPSEDDSGVRSSASSPFDVMSCDETNATSASGPVAPMIPLPPEEDRDALRVDKVRLVESYIDDGVIRRSTRIKTISSQKQRTSGHGLVRDKDRLMKKSNIGFDPYAVPPGEVVGYPAGESGMQGGQLLQGGMAANSSGPAWPVIANEGDSANVEMSEEYLRDMEEKLSRFETIRENIYHSDRIVSKEAKKMTCDCFLTTEEIDRGEHGCGEDCLNRLLMIECGSRCTVGDRCTNRRFQRQEYAHCQVFRTEKKGFGIQASTPIAPGEFIMEYVGEVLNSAQFDERAEV
uniref:AWS domain-containing protein n=1 Tax=Anopheles maculatus TaxID=74869 RepID=A0A182SYT9_9DIPT